MSRCLELMTLWRNYLWPVMHLKRIAQAAWFNPASNFTDWIAELKPKPGEIAFEHPLPSAYSSSALRRIHGEHEEGFAACCWGFRWMRPSYRPLSMAFTAAIATGWSATRWPAGVPASATPPPTRRR